MAKVYNPKLQNVPTAFNNISHQGKLRTLRGVLPGDDNDVVDLIATHVQGIAHTQDYVFLSYNRIRIAPTGLLAVVSKKTGWVVHWMYTPEETDNYPHPGGMQIIGDYLMVPVENGAHNQSYIHFYDLSSMTDKTPPTQLPYSLRRHNGSGGAGITNYTSGGVEYYLLAAYDNGKLYFYRSNGMTLAEDGIAFSLLFTTEVSQGGYSAVCLLTDKNNGLYMVGFWTENPESAPVDYVDLYSIDIENQSISDVLKSRHMITQYGDILGPAGVHFRFSAGLRILSDTTLKAYATQRNFVSGALASNGFAPK